MPQSSFFICKTANTGSAIILLKIELKKNKKDCAAFLDSEWLKRYDFSIRQCVCIVFIYEFSSILFYRRVKWQMWILKKYWPVLVLPA